MLTTVPLARRKERNRDGSEGVNLSNYFFLKITVGTLHGPGGGWHSG